jgi:ubiquinone/menaquinone biosynthesis C-methylase UbiE
MIKSKAWNWKVAKAPWWEKPSPEIYPLIKKWQKQGFKKVLDLGCGVGRHSILFAQNGFNVDAFDLSESGIEELKKKIGKEKLPIKLMIGDMLSLPYKNNSFDCLLAYHVVYHTDEKGIEKIIEEIKRVLKPGGEFFLDFNSKMSSAFKNKKNKHLTDHVLFKTEGHEINIPHYYADKKDVHSLLTGFEILKFVHKEKSFPDNYQSAHYFVLGKNKK